MGLETLISLLVTLVIFGLIWWLFQTYILPKVAEPFGTIIIVILVLFVIFWLLSLIGVVPGVRLFHR